MIAIFARSNHPRGYGYGETAHGYVVVGVRCRTGKQVEQVIKHIGQHGLDLPDGNRTIFPNGKPDKPFATNVGYPGVMRWYSGGPGDWDYLMTISGNQIQAVETDKWRAANWGSLGDNRFTLVYDAKEVLS